MNIVVTWPKDRALGSYLAELAKAERAGALAYYRIAVPPPHVRKGKRWTGPKVEEGDRCYRVHDGAVRGYLTIMGVREMGGNVIDNVTGLPFKRGLYIECHPLWHPLKPTIEMRGFQGYRYWKGENP
jgi:hypothetical protein